MIKTLVICPLFTRSGYGEHARFIVDALMSRPDTFDLYIHPIHWGESSWIAATSPKISVYENLARKREMYEGEYDLTIQVTIPSEWGPYSQEFPARCNIGITAGIETDRIPTPWIEASNKMDHIIFTSRHSQQGFENTVFQQKSVGSENLITSKGISTSSEVIGYPVKKIMPEDLSQKMVLNTDFNFLTITQLAPRKNVDYLLKWFVKEFREENVGLVCKMHAANNSKLDKHMLYNQFFKQVEGDQPRKCKIHWIHGSMSEQELHGLYTHPQINAYVSTTHGEGFGLPFFEAAYRGLPICATGWSGHLDFLKVPTPNGKKTVDMYEKIRYELKEVDESAYMDNIILPDMKWAYPQEKSARKAMRNVYNAYVAKKRIAAKLQTILEDNYSEEEQYHKICESCLKTYENKTNWVEAMHQIEVV